MDLQAMDRAHRIGQKKEVQVFRFCIENSIEEKVIEKAYKKLRLDAMVIQQGRLTENAGSKVNKEDLMSMVRYGAELVFQGGGRRVVLRRAAGSLLRACVAACVLLACVAACCSLLPAAARGCGARLFLPCVCCAAAAAGARARGRGSACAPAPPSSSSAHQASLATYIGPFLTLPPPPNTHSPKHTSARSNAAITDEDIDAILAKGEAATRELNQKMSAFTEAAVKFTLDGGLAASVYEYKDEEEGGGAGGLPDHVKARAARGGCCPALGDLGRGVLMGGTGAERALPACARGFGTHARMRFPPSLSRVHAPSSSLHHHPQPSISSTPPNLPTPP